jgi:hypothetical protein
LKPTLETFVDIGKRKMEIKDFGRRMVEGFGGFGVFRMPDVDSRSNSRWCLSTEVCLPDRRKFLSFEQLACHEEKMFSFKLHFYS